MIPIIWFDISSIQRLFSAVSYIPLFTLTKIKTRKFLPTQESYKPSPCWSQLVLIKQINVKITQMSTNE